MVIVCKINILALFCVTIILPRTDAEKVCSSHQVKRRNNNGEEVCCFGSHCDPNHIFEGCQADNENDTCIPCPTGKINPSEFNSQYFEAFSVTCNVPDCNCVDKYAYLVNEEECKTTGRRICVCDRAKLKFGPDPKKCETASNPCDKIGLELKNDGTCGPCDSGFEKIKADNSTCVPISSIASTTPVFDLSSSASSIPESKNEVTTAVPIGNPTAGPTQTDAGFNYLAVVIPVVGVALIIVIIIWVICKCRGRSQSSERVRQKPDSSRSERNGYLNGNIQHPQEQRPDSSRSERNGYVNRSIQHRQENGQIGGAVNQNSLPTDAEETFVVNIPDDSSEINKLLPTNETTRSSLTVDKSSYPSQSGTDHQSSTQHLPERENVVKCGNANPQSERSGQHGLVVNGDVYHRGDQATGESEPLISAQQTPDVPYNTSELNNRMGFGNQRDQQFQNNLGNSDSSFNKGDNNCNVSVSGNSIKVDGNLVINITQGNGNTNDNNSKSDNSTNKGKSTTAKESDSDSARFNSDNLNNHTCTPEYRTTHPDIKQGGFQKTMEEMDNTEPKKLESEVVENEHSSMEKEQLENDSSQGSTLAESIDISPQSRPVGIVEGQIQQPQVEDNAVLGQPVNDNNARFYLGDRLLDPPVRDPVTGDFNNLSALDSLIQNDSDSGIDRATNAS